MPKLCSLVPGHMRRVCLLFKGTCSTGTDCCSGECVNGQCACLQRASTLLVHRIRRVAVVSAKPMGLVLEELAQEKAYFHKANILV